VDEEEMMISTYQLSIRSGPNPGKSYTLDRNELFIGRDTTNDIVISDPEVSRRHARLFLQGANYVIEDLGSTNGTSVGGQRLAGPYVLRSGDAITLGEHVGLVFEVVSSDPDATVASAVVRPPMHQAPPVIQQPQYVPPPQPVQTYREPPPPPVPVYEENVVSTPRRLPGWVIPVAIALLSTLTACGATCCPSSSRPASKSVLCLHESPPSKRGFFL
jgi:hypothetical protein